MYSLIEATTVVELSVSAGNGVARYAYAEDGGNHLPVATVGVDMIDGYNLYKMSIMPLVPTVLTSAINIIHSPRPSLGWLLRLT